MAESSCLEPFRRKRVGMALWEVNRRWIDHNEVNAKAIKKS
ncbi:hypothetical protein [Methylocystis sp.]